MKNVSAKLKDQSLTSIHGYDSEIMTGKRIIRWALSSLLSFSGIHSLMERFCFSDRALVLMYHRILASAEKQPCFVQPGMFVATTTFEKQIAFIMERFKVVFLEDLVEKMLKGDDIGRYCSITFDDGWRDNYTDAFPVLKKFRVPATIFLATGFVGTDRVFWPEELCCYLARDVAGKPAYKDGPPSLIRFNEEIGRYARAREDTFFDSAIELLKKFPPGERDELLEYFRGQFGTDPIPRQMLSWEEAREMLASGLVRFGSHTVNHEMLDQVPLEKARDEISLSRGEIERCLGGTVRTFAYPNGNHSESIRNILTKNGFNAAVTTRKGLLKRDLPLMEVPRIAIHEDVSNTIPMFRSRILFRKF